MEQKLLCVGALLWAGFFLAFYRIGKLRYLTTLLRRTKNSVDEAARRRLLESRMRLSDATKKENFWLSLERELVYSGLKRRFPALGAELFFLLVVCGTALCFIIGTMFFGIRAGLLCVLLLVGAVYGVITLGKAMEMHAVNEGLMKFLDFLGNYSVTAGDVVSVFGQISKFLDEPLRGVLEQCCVEAQTTGDVGMALLAMADKVEHPQFKELVRNIEVSCRYSADFSALVNFSRRSVREYLRSTRERKSLLREAGINMALLLGMSVVSLLTVNGLLEGNVWELLFFSIPGRIALGIVAGILFLFAMQAYQLEG
jgi:Flp pilus assembly protein TadB